ncbi:MAG: HEAT repeat domain-containing protein [Planctomycetota bacterium]|jgi:HEAT repeat protein
MIGRPRAKFILLLLGLAIALPLQAKEEEERETPEQIAKVKRFAKMLESKNKLTVVEGLKLLGQIKTKSAVAELMGFVKRSKNAEHASYAVRELGEAGHKSAVDFLCGKYGVKSKKNLVAEEACRSLGKIGDRRAVPTLIEVIKSAKDFIAAAAIEAIVTLDTSAKGLAKLMVKMSKHKSDRVRRSVALAMAKLSDPIVVDALIRMATRDGNSIVRENACGSLGELRAVKARPALEQVVRKDKSQPVREAAHRALARIPLPKEEK